jgi:hypothetical protein
MVEEVDGVSGGEEVDEARIVSSCWDVKADMMNVNQISD